MRVLAALSGGVDSAVAAALAVDAGHDVTAVHLALAAAPAPAGGRSRGCCTPEDARDARRVADVLGVPFYVWDLAERFHRDVTSDFLAEYAAGRTPNPCLRCNERIKFAAVADRAVALGFDVVCTGHYARLRGGLLYRGVDRLKDQSYVLAGLSADQLRRACFPLGSLTKPQVRAEAAGRGLAVAGKPDSHDVCFIPDGDTAGWLRARLGPAAGPVVDAASGAVLGGHDGAYAYTVGQRRGLRLARPAPDGVARYVLDVSVATGTVRVGPADALAVPALWAGPPTWCGPTPAGPVECLAQLRAHGEPVGCRAQVRDGRLHVAFHRPVRAAAPGQAVVLYQGERVLGSATVQATVPAGSVPT